MPLDTKAIAEATAAVVKVHVAALVDPLRAAIAALEKRIDSFPVPQNGKDADEEAIAARVRDDVSAELKELRGLVEAIQPAAELPDIAGMVEQAVSDARDQDAAQIQTWMDGVDQKLAALPMPRDGKDADPELIKRLVDEAVAAIPPAPAGKDADLEIVRQMVAEAVDAIPAPKDGKDADPVDPEQIRMMVAEIVGPALAAIPVPENGKSVTLDDVRPMIEEAVAKAVSALPSPKDGVGVAGAIIDRDGALILTLTDGSTKNLGPVVGRDADIAAFEARIKELVDAIPRPRDGRDGLGFDDLDLIEDDRGMVLRFARDDVVKDFVLPVVIDRGVYREGVTFLKGSGVTWGGSFWIAQRDTFTKPDAPDSGWRLAVKKGQNGKDAK